MELYGTGDINDLTYHADIGYFPAADAEDVQGFIRFTNTTAENQFVYLRGYDDNGTEAENGITILLRPLATVPINSNDIELGNDSKGLSNWFGNCEGDWHFQVWTTGPEDVAASMRTSNGFLTPLDATTSARFGEVHTVPMMNPGSNRTKVSLLRLINQYSDENRFYINAIDDAGNPGAEQVVVTVPAKGVKMLDIANLEAATGVTF